MTLTISFPADTEAKLRNAAAATGKDLSTLVREAVEEKLGCEDVPTFPSQFAKAIEESRDLLTLRDEDDQLMVASATWERATKFLASCADTALKSGGQSIDTPAIIPGPRGSVDLHWKTADYEMLVNIPADLNELPTYYGDDQSGKPPAGMI